MQKVEGLVRGDRVITKQALFDASDHRLGMLFPDCVNVGSAARVFNATLQCTSTYRFDNGQLVSAGVVNSTPGSAPASRSSAVAAPTGQLAAKSRQEPP